MGLDDGVPVAVGELRGGEVPAGGAGCVGGVEAEGVLVAHAAVVGGGGGRAGQGRGQGGEEEGEAEHVAAEAAPAPDSTAHAQNTPTQREDNPESPVTDTMREPVVDVAKEVGFVKDPTKDNVPEVAQEISVHNQQGPMQRPPKSTANREIGVDAAHTVHDVHESPPPIQKSDDPSYEIVHLAPALDGRTLTPCHPVADGGLPVPSPSTQHNASGPGAIPGHVKAAKQTATTPAPARTPSSGQGHNQAKPSSSRPNGTRSQQYTPTPVQHKTNQTAQVPKSYRSKEEKTYVSKKQSRL